MQFDFMQTLGMKNCKTCRLNTATIFVQIDKKYLSLAAPQVERNRPPNVMSRRVVAQIQFTTWEEHYDQF